MQSYEPEPVPMGVSGIVGTLSASVLSSTNEEISELLFILQIVYVYAMVNF